MECCEKMMNSIFQDLVNKKEAAPIQEQLQVTHNPDVQSNSIFQFSIINLTGQVLLNRFHHILPLA